jgi:hypothetical protein
VARHVPLTVTVTTICGILVFGVHCGGGPSTGSGFTETQLYCQAAAVQLLDCCPGYVAGFLTCDRQDFQASQSSSCAGTTSNSTTNYPTLSLSESTCILNESCQELVATKVCSRAVKAVGQGAMTVTQVDSEGCGTSPSTEQTYYEDAPIDASDVPKPSGLVCP